MSGQVSIRWTQRSAIVCAVVVISTVVIADEVPVYKSTGSSGEITYGDAPPSGARDTRVILVEPHPADPRAAAIAQNNLTETRQRMMREAEDRQRKLDVLDREVSVAASRDKSAQWELAKGREIGEGDRQGRRLAPRYWERQDALEREARLARMELDRLRAQRAMLR